MKKHYIAIQCFDWNSRTVGDFLFEDTGDSKKHAISPVFDQLGKLFCWMRENGWVSKVGERGWYYEPSSVIFN